MNRVAYLALLFAAFGVDDRPPTLELVTEQVLTPSCSAAQCHSSFSPNRQIAMDSVVGARAAIVNGGSFGPLVFQNSDEYDPANPAGAPLIQWITQDNPFNANI